MTSSADSTPKLTPALDDLVEQRTRLVGISFGECIGERGEAHGDRAGRGDLAGEGQALGRQRDRGVDVAPNGVEAGRARDHARRLPELTHRLIERGRRGPASPPPPPMHRPRTRPEPSQRAPPRRSHRRGGCRGAFRRRAHRRHAVRRAHGRRASPRTTRRSRAHTDTRDAPARPAAPAGSPSADEAGSRSRGLYSEGCGPTAARCRRRAHRPRNR